MRSLLFAILTGLVGAALLHIIIILSLPQFTLQDAAARVEALGDANQFYLLDSGTTPAGLTNGDPYLQVAVCSFSLDETPIRLMAEGDVPFWSLAIYDSKGNEVFSMNDRTAVDGAMDLLLASPTQINGVRKTLASQAEDTILVEMAADDGYAVLRTFAPLPSMDAAARTFLTGASCDAF